MTANEGHGAAVQTLWAELIAASLVDAGVTTCVVSPGSRSAPLVAALAADGRLDLPAIIDERAAAYFALGVARATGCPAAMVCTSGTAAAHYLPAIVEASAASVPLIVITADRPAELQRCGAMQTIDQIGMYGGFVRGAFDLGAPVGSALAFRAVRRKLVQAVTLARGPHPGPVHVEVPLRKPLEPAAPTDDERPIARVVAELRATPVVTRAPRLVADGASLDALAAAIAAEPCGLVIAGAMPAGFAAARDLVFALAARAGYPVLAEAGSQLRFGPRPTGVTAVDHFDLAIERGPAPRLIIQLGAAPVAPTAFDAPRWVLAAHAWHDPESSARAVVIGDVASSIAGLVERVPARGGGAFAAAWLAEELRVVAAIDRSLADHPRSEGAVLRAALGALPERALVQLGNSLPVRVVDQVCTSSRTRGVITQRGVAGIDGLVASAAGATRGGPVLLVLGDVSFAHDVGGLLAAREVSAPLAIVVIDNGGGRIFDGLPIARAGLASYERYFSTPPALDPVAVAVALGARGVLAASPAAVAAAVTAALETRGVTVIHAPVTSSGAHDLRRHTFELLIAGDRHA